MRITASRTLNYLAGAAVAAFAIYAFIRQEPALGVVCLGLSLMLATTISYIEFDFVAGYKGEFTSLFGFMPMGGWERLPKGRWLILKRFSEYEYKYKYATSRTKRHRRYLLMLSIADGEEGHIIMSFSDLKEARKTTNAIALASQLEFKDYTH